MFALSKIVKFYDSVEAMSNLSDNWIPVRGGMPRMDECLFQV